MIDIYTDEMKLKDINHRPKGQQLLFANNKEDIISILLEMKEFENLYTRVLNRVETLQQYKQEQEQLQAQLQEKDAEIDKLKDDAINQEETIIENQEYRQILIDRDNEIEQLRAELGRVKDILRK